MTINSGGTSRIMSALLGSGDITLRQKKQAEYWAAQVVMACSGYREVEATAVHGNTTRHDALSWMMLRGKSSSWVKDMATAMGESVTRRLWGVLIDGRSFSQLGASQYPHLSQSRAASRVSAQFVMVLEILDEQMSKNRRSQRAR